MMIEEVVSQFVLGAQGVGVIEFLKDKGWFGKTQNIVKTLSIAASVTYAFVTSIGVHLQFEGNIVEGLRFEGSTPHISVLLSGLEHYFASFTSQQGLYMILKMCKAMIEMNTRQRGYPTGQYRVPAVPPVNPT